MKIESYVIWCVVCWDAVKPSSPCTWIARTHYKLVFDASHTWLTMKHFGSSFFSCTWNVQHYFCMLHHKMMVLYQFGNTGFCSIGSQIFYNLLLTTGFNFLFLWRRGKVYERTTIWDFTTFWKISRPSSPCRSLQGQIYYLVATLTLWGLRTGLIEQEILRHPLYCCTRWRWVSANPSRIELPTRNLQLLQASILPVRETSPSCRESIWKPIYNINI